MAGGVSLMLLITITQPNGEFILRNLLQACARKACEVCVFFTGQGVHLLEDEGVLTALAEAAEAVACAESWKESFQHDCPVTSGSQTDHSRLIGEAQHVLSL